MFQRLERMNKIDAYHWLCAIGKDVGWIANVFLVSGGKYSAANIQAMVRIIRQGGELGSLSFTMPYEQLLVDGKSMTPAEMRAYSRRNDG